MIITKEQQEAMVDNYIKKGYNQDAVIGFIDGMGEAVELMIRLSAKDKQ